MKRKTKEPKPITLDELIQAHGISRGTSIAETPPPPNAFTLDDFAKKLGMSPSGAHARLNKMIRAGLIKKHEPAGRKNYYIPIA